MQTPTVCPTCGNSLLRDAKFCARCGASLAPAGQGDANQELLQPDPKMFCTVCGTELSLLHRSPKHGVCLKCFADQGLWRKIKPTNEWALAQIQDTLDEGEVVISTVSGWHSYDPPKVLQTLMPAERNLPKLPFLIWTGYLIATTTRIVFYIRKHMLDEVRSYPLSTISSIRIDKGWIHKVFGPGAAYGISFVSADKQVNLLGCPAAEYDEAVKFVDFVHANKGKTPAASVMDAASATTMSSRDVFTELQRLSELKDKGIITEDEFQTKKRVLLEKIT